MNFFTAQDVAATAAYMLAVQLDGIESEVGEKPAELQGSPPWRAKYEQLNSSTFPLGQWQMQRNMDGLLPVIMESAVLELADQIRQATPRKFVFRPMTVPVGLDAGNGAAADKSSRVSVRLVRAYDLNTDSIIARLSCLVDR